jgi:hypothetical protein
MFQRPLGIWPSGALTIPHPVEHEFDFLIWYKSQASKVSIIDIFNCLECTHVADNICVYKQWRFMK